MKTTQILRKQKPELKILDKISWNSDRDQYMKLIQNLRSEKTVATRFVHIGSDPNTGPEEFRNEFVNRDDHLRSYSNEDARENLSEPFRLFANDPIFVPTLKPSKLIPGLDDPISNHVVG